ncbi:unnamed protein product [Linum tenue]|nr:unnamed protein product [Linum tenue]
MLGDFYITVRPWRKNFNPKLAEVASTMVWARFPGLPREFINKHAVERIAEKIGRPVRVDRATESGDRGKYARVSIEVDLTKPLLSKFKIEGITYYVEYEGLHRICTECGKYGHMKVTCPNLFRESAQGPPAAETESEAPMGDYGEWMMVKPRGKGVSRNTQDLRQNFEGQKKAPQVHKEMGSRFAVLDEEEHNDKHVTIDAQQDEPNRVVDTTAPEDTTPTHREEASSSLHGLADSNSTALTGKHTNLREEIGKSGIHGANEALPKRTELRPAQTLVVENNGKQEEPPRMVTQVSPSDVGKMKNQVQAKKNTAHTVVKKQVGSQAKGPSTKQGAGSLSPPVHK